MAENGPTGGDPVPPPVTLLQMMTGYWVSQALYVAAKLGVADLLADGPRPVEVLAGGDAYVLAHILHDWDDERSVVILRQCRRAMPAHGKPLVVELVLPPGEEPFFGKWLDLHMLVMLGARERTAPEYEALFRAAGLALARVVPTAAGPSIVEAVSV